LLNSHPIKLTLVYTIMPRLSALALVALAALLAACTSAPPEAELPAQPAKDPLMEMLNNRPRRV